ncbi:hypothetical protein AS180_17940 [Priestia veravalensis]|uniref:Uncharacterized protein n=1 Tax=Priestia veravalensis TaxID=1414648 RepID=A0A0V8JHW3_9BACI|nr:MULTISPECIES: hypothetical protein [Priestia]KSU86569.1 hypothetical protein AS180_17940 [Priestia veravalensis]SCC50794.1 hypothetical protein GA0061087_106619 [Priestia flexa]
MICANCGEAIHSIDRYYRAGKNGTLFCSEDCSYEAFEGFYSKQEVEKTLVCHIGKGDSADVKFHVDGEAALEVAKVLEMALTKDPPFIMTVKNGVGEYQKIASREEFLEHYLSWAIGTLYDLTDTEE